MMEVLQGFHVLLATFWFGSVLFADFILIPTIMSLEANHQAAVMNALQKRVARIMMPVSILTILTGVLLGIKLDILNHWTWIASLSVSLLVFLWAHITIIPTEKKMKKAAEGSPEFAHHLSRLKLFVMLELLYLIIIFILMVLMRFGIE